MIVRRVLLSRGSASFAELDAGELRLLSAAPWEGGKRTGEVVREDDVTLLPPSVPSKILCVGRNYAAHAKELGNEVPKEPLFFFKPPSSLLADGGTIVLPEESERVEHEAELAVVIGKRAKAVREEEAMRHVFGLTVSLDVTARDLQKKDGQWWRAKGFDTFCPVGPGIVTDVDPSDLAIVCRVNGEARQAGRTSAMHFKLPFLIAYASRMMTLEPGDLLLTGTPEGVGPLRDGDRVEVEIERVGWLRVGVAGPSRAP